MTRSQRWRRESSDFGLLKNDRERNDVSPNSIDICGTKPSSLLVHGHAALHICLHFTTRPKALVVRWHAFDALQHWAMLFDFRMQQWMWDRDISIASTGRHSVLMSPFQRAISLSLLPSSSSSSSSSSSLSPPVQSQWSESGSRSLASTESNTKSPAMPWVH